jgi:hypothetical protein
VAGRRHAELQTEVYLEELVDTPPEAEGATQTDAFLDRPATPLFVPPSSGTDAATQIENGARRFWQKLVVQVAALRGCVEALR